MNYREIAAMLADGKSSEDIVKEFTDALNKATAEQKAAEEAKAKEKEKKEKEKAKKKKSTAAKKTTSAFNKTVNSAANTIGREIGKKVVRGIFDTFFKG